MQSDGIDGCRTHHTAVKCSSTDITKAGNKKR